jgi:hypothetical protein
MSYFNANIKARALEVTAISTGTVNVANDSITFIDADDSNATKKNLLLIWYLELIALA